MEGTISGNASWLLKSLYDLAKEGQREVSGQILAEQGNMTPTSVVDAVAMLEDAGLVECRRWMGTAPYDFGGVSITSRGKYEWEKVLRSRGCYQALPFRRSPIYRQQLPRLNIRKQLLSHRLLWARRMDLLILIGKWWLRPRLHTVSCELYLVISFGLSTTTPTC